MITRLLRSIVTAIAPPELRDALLDDLDESFAREAASRSRLGAAWWRTRQLASAVVEVIKLRQRRRQPAIEDADAPSIVRSFLRDARHAIRLLRRSPGFTGMAVGTLALGIGANAAIFSLVKAVLIEPLPYADPSRLVMIWNPSEQKEPTWLAVPELDSYRASSRSLAMVGHWTTGDANLTGGGEPERLRLGVVSGELFDTLGIPAALGRPIERADAETGAANVVVLGYALWQRRFGGDATIVGQKISINGQTREVIGVMPAAFRLPMDYRDDQPTEGWIPLVLPDPARTNWSDHSYFGVARLVPGVTPDAAGAELRGVEDTWVRDGHRPKPANDRWHRSALPLPSFISGTARQPLLILLAAVAGVLLIACANVVNLLLVRSDARRHEVLVRSSLGAERGALVRQAMTESLVLAVAGAAVGLGVARLALQVLIALRPSGLPRLADVTIDGGVVMFAAVVAVVAALVFGAGPAWQFSRANLAEALRDGGRTLTPGRARMAVGRLLVVGQLACSVVLVIGAGLLMRTLVQLYHVDLGFNPSNVLTAQIQVPVGPYPTPDRVVDFYRTLVDRIERAPGVESAAAIRVLPLSRIIGDWSITVEDHPSGPNENPNGDFQWTTPDYFTTMRASLARGRLFAKTDESTTLPVAVLNEAMARRYWPTEDAVGRRFRMGTAAQAWITVIGVIRNTHANTVIEPPRSEIYLLHSQLPATIGGAARGMDLVIRTTGDPMAFAGTLRSIVHGLDASLPIARIRPLEDVVASALSGPRFAATLLAVFAGLALVLAAIGTYGTMAMLVSARTPEIGIRLALGAGRASIFKLIVGHGLTIAGVGIALGLGGAVAASRVLESLLFGVRPLDVMTFLVAPAALAAMAFIACAIPARRAARVDPLTTMRD